METDVVHIRLKSKIGLFSDCVCQKSPLSVSYVSWKIADVSANLSSYTLARRDPEWHAARR